MESGPWKKRRRAKQKRHQPSGTSSLGKERRAGGSQKPSKSVKRRTVKPTSSFSAITPSSASITFEEKQSPPVWRGYLFGLVGITLLILLGGGHNVYALSLSLLLPGIALLFNPPRKSQGVWMDRMALAFLAVLLLSFIPQFYWPTPEWRTAAVEIFGITLPASLSIQPMLSFEAWVSALAGFAWFYAASSWQINGPGRKWFYFSLCLVVGGLAAVVLWGNVSGVKYPSAENSTVFTFFPNRNQTSNFLALGGVAAFGYFMCALRARRLMPIIGFVVSGLSFLALVWGVSRAGVILFFVGILIWYFLHLGSGRMARGVKLGIPLALIAFSVFIVSNSRATERVVDFLASPSNWSEDFRSLIAKDTFEMIEDAPLTGHGLGTFSAVFPQYRNSSASYQRAVHPESDILWLTAETGILGLALFLGFIISYLVRCRGLSNGPSGSLRLVAFAPLLIFMLHAFVDVSGHRPGTVYFAILFAALALPPSKQKKPTLKPKVWRLCGGFLIMCGVIWGVSGPAGLPFHSSVASSNYQIKIKEGIKEDNYEAALLGVNKWIELRPLDWRAYFQRATLTLSDSGERGKAAADFRRARFVEPTLGIVALEEGFVWIPYDAGRAVAAWREVFFRELESVSSARRSILDAAYHNPELLPRLARLSELDTHFRTYFLGYQSGDYLMQEIRHDLETDPSLGQFTRKQRTSILKNWILRGDHQAAENFLKENGTSLNRPWWLWSLLRKEQANFEGAVNHIRSAIKPPNLPEISTADVPFDRLNREFTVAPGDVMKGTTLLKIYLQKGNFHKVKEVAQAMITAQREVPLYVNYLQAESHYQLQDYTESWYAFETYLKLLWAQE